MEDSTNTDYTKFKEDPELLRVLLQNTVKKVVTDGWSDDCLTPELKKLLQWTSTSFTENINKYIDDMWKEYNISKKVKVITKVAKETPADFIACRPTTGTIPETNFKGNDLTEQKEMLLNQLKKNRIHKEQLQNILNTKENIFNKYCTKLSEASEHINNIETL